MAKSQAATNAATTFIDILLDETGSMQSCHGATVTGFNDFIRDQRELDGDCYLTLSKFDSSGIRTPYVNLPLDMVPELMFFPGAATNLYDVVGQRTREVLAQPRQGRSLIVVITDGEENASREFNLQQVNSVVTEALSKGITFLYFGAGQGAHSTALSMGIPETSVNIFDTRKMGETMVRMSAATRAFRARV